MTKFVLCIKADCTSVQDIDIGFPNLALFADSDESFGVYRRFGYVQARILQDLQDELRVLEEQLDHTEHMIYDEEDNAFQQLCKRTGAQSDSDPRKILVEKLKAKWLEYSTFYY